MHFISSCILSDIDVLHITHYRHLTITKSVGASWRGRCTRVDPIYNLNQYFTYASFVIKQKHLRYSQIVKSAIIEILNVKNEI